MKPQILSTWPGYTAAAAMRDVFAGGTTPVAGMVHALVILLIFLFAAPLANYLALPALGGLLLLTAWNMSEPHHWHSYVNSGACL